MVPLVAKRAELLRKVAYSGATKGKLSMLRSALYAYQESHGGRYPASLELLEEGGGKLKIPEALTFYHPYSSAVLYSTSPTDTGGWIYNNIEGHPEFGRVAVNCTHTDTKGIVWSSF